VYERITLNWSTRSHLVWNHASKSFKYICNNDSIYKALNDISISTKSRALAEYGLLVITNNFFEYLYIYVLYLFLICIVARIIPKW
jgi:hypothetical protein